MKRIGFVIITHNNPQQALRLMSRLNEVYDSPPIAWHHDFSKTDFPQELLTSNVKMVKEFVKTSWGTFSLVEAKLKALELLYSESSPDYYYTLSGADYPVRSASEVLNDLGKLNGDVFIRSSLISYTHQDKKWKKQYYDRYCSLKLLFKRKNKAKLTVVSQITFLRHPMLTRFFNPFNDKLQCWGGEFWYTGTKKSAEYLLRYVKEDKHGLVKHYRNTKIPDESMFQTIFNNAEEIRCVNNNFRYIDWSEGLPHPKTLLLEDIPKIAKANAHFARKFDSNISLDAINQLNKI
jgi:hypothetical protein